MNGAITCCASGARCDRPAGGRLAIGLVLLLAAGCQTPAGKDPAAALVWPSPPAAPRVRLDRVAAAPRDLGVAPAWWRRAAGWVLGGAAGQEPWVCPLAVAVDGTAQVCFTDTGRGEVVWVDLAQRRLARWDRVGDTRLVLPVGVALSGDTVFVADSALRRVLRADVQGRPRGRLDFDFARPVAVAAGGGRLLVADAVACCVQVFTLDGQWLQKIGGPGDGPGQLNRPTHLAVDRSGQVYVTDALNCRIQVYAADGRFLRTIGRPGDSSGHFGRPKGVAVDAAGHVLVVDGLHERLQIFDGDGRFNLDVGGPGQAPGSFWLPAGLAVSADGQVVVADSYNQRLQFFRLLPDGEESP